MHLAQIVIKFTNSERYELENIIAPLKTDPKEGRSTERSIPCQQDLEFKNLLVNFIRSTKNTLQDRNRCLERLREFLLEQKCIQEDSGNLLQSGGGDSLAVGLQKLRMKLSQMQKNNGVFELFVGCLEEMKDLQEEHIYEFEYKLSKATILSRMERETLALIAKKIVKVDSLGRMGDLEDDISAFLTKIMKYGIHQEFKELERMGSSEIKNKCIKLVEYLQGNCIEMKQEFNPVRSLIKKLSISIYDKSEIKANLAELPENVRGIFEPLCAEVFRLRDSSMKTSIIGETGLIYVSHDKKRAQDQNIEAMRREKQELKSKCSVLEEELKHTKLILEKLGHMSNLFREENLYETIEGQLGNTSQQVKIYLERIFCHLKSFEELTLGARKASFIERKDNQIEFLQEKLSSALQQLDVLRTNKFTIHQTESILLDENNELQDRTSQNERLILQYQTEMSSLNAQISTYSKEINKLNGELFDSEKQVQLFLKERTEMQRQIDRMMNLRKDQETQHQKELTLANQQLKKQIKVLKQQNASLLQKCQQRAAQHIQLQLKTKEAASLKYFQAENTHLMDLINHLNAEIKAKQSIINKFQAFPFPKQDEFVQTIQQQQTSTSVSQLNNQIKQLIEQKAKLEFLKAENDQLKQERFLRLNQQKQMKRIYREQRVDMSQLQQQLESYKDLYEKLTKDYDLLKKRHNQMKLQQFERKHYSQKNVTSEGNTDFDRQNLKKMQDKHRLLQKNFEEVKKYNELIKTQYHKLKQESTHAIKVKVKDLLEGSRQNQIKFKRQLEKSAIKITDLNAKVLILQQQNLNLKVKLQEKANSKQHLSDLRERNDFLTQSLNFTEQRQTSRSKEKMKDELSSIKIRNEKQHIRMLNQIRAKQEEISSQRIQILKLQHKLDHVYGQMNEMGVENQHSQKMMSEPNGKYSKDQK